MTPEAPPTCRSCHHPCRHPTRGFCARCLPKRPTHRRQRPRTTDTSLDERAFTLMLASGNPPRYSRDRVRQRLNETPDTHRPSTNRMKRLIANELARHSFLWLGHRWAAISLIATEHPDDHVAHTAAVTYIESTLRL